MKKSLLLLILISGCTQNENLHHSRGILAPDYYDDTENGVRCYMTGFGISCVKIKDKDQKECEYKINGVQGK